VQHKRWEVETLLVIINQSIFRFETVFGEKLDDVQGYKYLGVLEDSRNVIKEENKIKIKDKIVSRTEALCKTKLNAKNLVRAINEFAILTINYYIGIINYEPSEFEQLDKMIRQVLASNNDQKCIQS